MFRDICSEKICLENIFVGRNMFKKFVQKIGVKNIFVQKNMFRK